MATASNAERERARQRKLLRLEAERRFYESDLLRFAAAAWTVVEPQTIFQANWHHQLVAEYLTLAFHGKIRRLILNMPPQHSKPVAQDEPVVERSRGRIPLSEVRVGDEVLTHRGRFRAVTAVHDQGELSVFEVVTHSGRRVRAAGDHPFLTTRGWRELQHITAQDVLATVTPVEATGKPAVTPPEARLLGYLVGDGSCQGTQIGVTNAEEAVLRDVEWCAASLGFATRRRPIPGRPTPTTFIVLTASQGRWAAKLGPNPLREWLARHELLGTSSYTKRVPPAILGATADLVAEYLGAYWSCDGFVALRTGRADVMIGADTVSEVLARDTQHLLLRLGINARLRRKEAPIRTKRQGESYVSWNLAISTMDHASKFAAIVRLQHPRRSALAARYPRSAFDRPLYEDPVVSVRPAGRALCRCLTVAEDGSFTAGDLAVHNSRFVTVMWPCWAWGQRPGSSWIFSSFSALLSKQRHSHERRLILESDWYAERWGRQVEIAPGQNRQDEYQNTERGTMVATSTGGTVTGKGGDYIVVDDPMDPQRAYSDADRETANTYFDQTLYTRQRDPRTSVFVIVMQRLHNADLTGHVLEEKADLPWTVVDIQAEAEKRTVITYPMSGTVRTREPGDLLWPDRFTPAVLADYKLRLGSWGYSAQFLQRAVPFGGGVFKRDWWHFYGGPCARCNGIEHGLPGQMDEALQSWDCAFKDTEGSDFVSGQVWARRQADLFLLDRVCDRMNFPATISAVETMSAKWPSVITKLVEDKANGPAVIATLQHRVAGLIEVEPQGGKLARAHAASPVVEAGNCYIPHPQRAPWIHDWLQSLSAFPKGAHDDDVDAATQAILRLAGYFAGMGMYSILESQVAEQERGRATQRTILTTGGA